MWLKVLECLLQKIYHYIVWWSCTHCHVCRYCSYIIIYVLIQGSLFITFHVLGLCWGIVFPFHYRRFKVEGRIKYIHITSVILALALPAISALLHLIDGYSIGPGLIIIISNSVCGGRSRAITYFTTVLPLSVLSSMTMSVLVIMFWKLLKVKHT